MEYDRSDTKHPRTSAIANSLAYAASLVWLYAENFESLAPQHGLERAHPGPVRDNGDGNPVK